MAKRFGRRSQALVPLMTLVGTLAVGTPSEASEIVVRGLPCNDLCQAWLGLDRKEVVTGSVAKETRPKIRLSHSPESAPSNPSPEIRQLRVKPAKIKPAAPIEALPTPDRPKAVRMAKRGKPMDREVEADVPLPVPRPTIPSDPPSVTADAPASATSGSQDPPRKPVEAAAMRDVGARPAAPDGQVPPPAPDGTAVSGTDRPRTEPSQAERSPPIAALPSPAASKLPQTPQVAAVTPVDVPEAPVDDRVNAPTPSGVGDVGARKGSLQPLAELAGGQSPVTIGQISSGPRGTDVHVVIVNILHHEMKDIDVLCTVRDAQGLQLAEAYAHIADIAPSDVAFRQVVLPSGIAARGNGFVCRIGRVAAASDVTP